MNSAEQVCMEKIPGKFQLEQIDSKAEMMNRKLTLQYYDTHLELI